MSRPVERLEAGILAIYNTGSNQIYFDLSPRQEIDKAGVQVTPHLIADFTPLDLRRVRRPLLGLEVINASEFVWPVIGSDSFIEDASTLGIALSEPDPGESRLSVRQMLSGFRRIPGLARLIPEDVRYAARESEVIKTARIPTSKVLQIAERILGINQEQQVSGLGQMVLEDLRFRVELEGDTPLPAIIPPSYGTFSALGQARPTRPQS